MTLPKIEPRWQHLQRLLDGLDIDDTCSLRTKLVRAGRLAWDEPLSEARWGTKRDVDRCEDWRA